MELRNITQSSDLELKPSHLRYFGHIQRLGTIEPDKKPQSNFRQCFFVAPVSVLVELGLCNVVTKELFSAEFDELCVVSFILERKDCFAASWKV